MRKNKIMVAALAAALAIPVLAPTLSYAEEESKEIITPLATEEEVVDNEGIVDENLEDNGEEGSLDNSNESESIDTEDTLETSKVEIELPKDKVFNLEVYDITEYQDSVERQDDHQEYSKALREKTKDLEGLEKVSEHLDAKDSITLDLEKNKAYLIKEKDGKLDPFVVVGKYELNGDLITVSAKEIPDNEEPEKPDEPKKRETIKVQTGGSVATGIAVVASIAAGTFASKKKEN